MTGCHWAGVAFMLLSSSAWGQNEGAADSLLGPQTGDVTWSLRQHGLTWETPQMTLHLDPWFTVRHLTGTPPTTSEAAVSPWDNLRGAHFEAALDGVWHLEGSLEEMQGWAGAWDAATMTASTALPGWGRAKLTSGGRVDVARARVTSRYSRVSTQGDSLLFSTAYAPVQWGALPSPLTFSGEAASFPRASVTWVRSNGLSAQTTAARWTGTERGPAGGSTESLFRQTDAGWVDFGWRHPSRGSLGLLGGVLRERPWTGELATDSLGQFAWRSWLSVSSTWRTATDNVLVSVSGPPTKGGVWPRRGGPPRPGLSRWAPHGCPRWTTIASPCRMQARLCPPCSDLPGRQMPFGGPNCTDIGRPPHGPQGAGLQRWAPSRWPRLGWRMRCKRRGRCT